MQASSSASSPELSSALTSDSVNRFSYQQATLDEVLEDLSSRFILNLPDDELESLERVCFQVEQAHWYYEDFIREQNPTLHSLPLKKFSAMLFQACPLLHQWNHDHEQAFNHFMQYKTRVPVCGAIMLNDTWERVVLVKGWKANSGWGFPKGKINEDEPSHNCAIREVLEETGYNLAGQLNPEHVIEMSIREQKISLYIVPGVPEDYKFETRTRKEISKIQWFNLSDLPTWRRNKTAVGKFYLITPFIGALRAFVKDRRPRLKKGQKIKAAKTPAERRIAEREEASILSIQSLSDSWHEHRGQESSSQSSSVDNGDPQTPSPQYTNSVANPANGHVATVDADDDELSKSMTSGDMDPHVARLLSSLSRSAAAPADTKDTVKPALTPLSVAAPPASTTPVPITASSGGSPPRPESASRPDWSAHAPTRLLADTPEPATERFASENAPLSESRQSSPRNHQPFQPPPALPLRSYSSSNGTEKRTFGGPVPPPYNSPPSATLSTASTTSATSSSLSVSKPPSSRRSASTADISPYLSRSTEIPTSGKRMKQLALLESVADESTRMATPVSGFRDRDIPVGHMNGLNGSPMPFARGHPHVPGPPMSVPPQGGDPSDLRVIYSSNQDGPAVHGPPPMFHARPSFPPRPYNDDPFQVRPQTSHAFHPHQNGASYPSPFPTRASMNQSQLLAMLTGPSGGPGSHQTSGILQQPPLMMQSASFQHGPPPPFQHAYPPNGGLPPPHQQHLSLQQSVRGNFGHPSSVPGLPMQPQMVHSHSGNVPMSAPALSPGFNFPPPASNNNNLLSILNSKMGPMPNGMPHRA